MTPIQTALLDRVAKAMGRPRPRGPMSRCCGWARVPAVDKSEFGIEPPAMYQWGGEIGVATLRLNWSRDSAAKCMKPGWTWQKRNQDFSSSKAHEWVAALWKDGRLVARVSTPDTGDEIADRFTLGAMTWEAA